MRRLAFWPVAFVLGGFAVVTYAICLAADGLFSGLAMYKAWEPWLPGVSGLSFGSWLLGSIELVIYALYASGLLVVLTRLVSPNPEAAGRLAEASR